MLDILVFLFIPTYLGSIMSHFNISTKISKSLGILARLRHFVPSNTLLNMYRSLIQPYLSDGILAVWGKAAWKNLEKIFVLQKLNIRFINLLYFKTICLIMHDVFNNVTPPNVSNLFTYSSKIHHHNTRFSVAGNFYLQYSRTNHLKNSFSSIGA